MSRGIGNHNLKRKLRKFKKSLLVQTKRLPAKIELFPGVGQNDSFFWPGPYLATLPSNTRISVSVIPSALTGAGSGFSDNGPPPTPPESASKHSKRRGTSMKKSKKRRAIASVASWPLPQPAAPGPSPVTDRPFGHSIYHYVQTPDQPHSGRYVIYIYISATVPTGTTWRAV